MYLDVFQFDGFGELAGCIWTCGLFLMDLFS